MPYNFAADSFHTKKLCSRLSSSEVHFLIEIGRFAFLTVDTPFGGLRGNVRRSSQAHWKARSGLPISINWTFFARCYDWGATSDYWLKIGDFAPTGAGWHKISGRRGRPLPTILLLRKLGWMFFRMVYKSGQIFLPFCHNSRVWRTDRRTDRQNSHR